ncbi:hypothetical protein [Serratia fonticola]|uniref:hypothetical protein n=1 Tax=Serratia fonticola TaxID=47917 RepID=UPI0021BDE32D|nr:hypothetical protein [Serratia fonticola]
MGDDNAVIQAEVFGGKAAAKGFAVDHKGNNVVLKTVAEYLRQLHTAVGQGGVKLELTIDRHDGSKANNQSYTFSRE